MSRGSLPCSFLHLLYSRDVAQMVVAVVMHVFLCVCVSLLWRLYQFTSLTAFLKCRLACCSCRLNNPMAYHTDTASVLVKQGLPPATLALRIYVLHSLFTRELTSFLLCSILSLHCPNISPYSVSLQEPGFFFNPDLFKSIKSNTTTRLRKREPSNIVHKDM